MSKPRRKPCPFCGSLALELRRNGKWTRCSECSGTAPTWAWENRGKDCRKCGKPMALHIVKLNMKPVCPT